MKRETILGAALAFAMLAMCACGQRTKAKTTVENAANTASEVVEKAGDKVADAAGKATSSDANEMKIVLDRAPVVHIWLENAEGETGAELSGDDVRLFMACLADAEYDTKLNDSGVALKMTAPDYTLAIAHKDVAPDRLMIWIASGRMKYRSEWFNIRAKDLPAVATLLKKYK